MLAGWLWTEVDSTLRGDFPQTSSLLNILVCHAPKLIRLNPKQPINRACFARFSTCFAGIVLLALLGFNIFGVLWAYFWEVWNFSWVLVISGSDEAFIINISIFSAVSCCFTVLPILTNFLCGLLCVFIFFVFAGFFDLFFRILCLEGKIVNDVTVFMFL